MKNSFEESRIIGSGIILFLSFIIMIICAKKAKEDAGFGIFIFWIAFMIICILFTILGNKDDDF